MTALGKKNIIVYDTRITLIITKPVHRTRKGDYVTLEGRRYYLTEIEHETINGYECEYSLDFTR